MVVEGIIIYKVTDYPAAVKLARDTYATVFGAPPLCVALPSHIDPAALNLDGLPVARHPASAGTVQALGEIARPVVVKSNGHEQEAEPEPPRPFYDDHYRCRKCEAEQLIITSKCWACGFKGGNEL